MRFLMVGYCILLYKIVDKEKLARYYTIEDNVVEAGK